MTLKYAPFAVLAIVAALSACSSMPKTTSLLDQTRSDYQVAQHNPKVASYAPLEMQKATEALDQANTAASKDEGTDKIDRLAYVAKQKIALTQEVAAQKSAEADVASSAKQRDEMRLDQRTAEADKAKQAALLAQQQADSATLQTKDAQAQAENAQRQTMEAQAHAAQLEAQLADLAAKKTERGIVITLGDILFGTDVAQLNADGVRTAKKLGDVLLQNPQRTVMVEGFTDSTGSKGHNQELSERRASSVSAVLNQMGVASSRIIIKGYGDAFPVASNSTSQDRQMNRRVEIVLSDENGKVTQR